MVHEIFGSFHPTTKNYPVRPMKLNGNALAKINDGMRPQKT